MIELFLIFIIAVLATMLYKEKSTCIPIAGFKYQHKRISSYIVVVQSAYGNSIHFNRVGVDEDQQMHLYDFERAFVEYTD